MDNFSSSLSNHTGGRYLEFPYIAAQGTVSQYASANNTPIIVAWNQLDAGNAFTLNTDNTATAQQSGYYKIDFSLQFANTANTQEYVWVWLKVNGVNVAGSGSKFSVSARKSVGNDSYLVAYSSVTFRLNAGDSVGLWWATSLAYKVSPATDGIYMEAYTASTSPFSMPSVPAAIGSIVFVSSL